MAWAGWAKSRSPRVPGKNFVAWASCARAWVKLLTDCKFWAVNCTKCVWRPGSARTRWGAIALPRPPGRYKGERKGSGEEGKGWEEEGRVKGGMERKGERVGKGKGGLDLDICPAPQVLSYATASVLF